MWFYRFYFSERRGRGDLGKKITRGKFSNIFFMRKSQNKLSK